MLSWKQSLPGTTSIAQVIVLRLGTYAAQLDHHIRLTKNLRHISLQLVPKSRYLHTMTVVAFSSHLSIYKQLVACDDFHCLFTIWYVGAHSSSMQLLGQCGNSCIPCRSLVHTHPSIYKQLVACNDFHCFFTIWYVGAHSWTHFSEVSP